MATTPVERVVTIHGHAMAYTDTGEGPTLLFIHGLLGSQRQWAHLVDVLGDDHRVVVPDLFGHGESARPVGDYSLGAHAATLRDLLDRLGIEQVTLVGHSLGGGIAMVFTYLFPERVEGLVLVASGGLGREVSPLLRSATLPGAEWVLPVIASGWVRDRVGAAARALGAVGVRPGSDAREVWTGFSSLGDADTRRAFLATTRAVIDPGGQTVAAEDYLAEAPTVPTLVVWGTKDRMIPAWHAGAAASHIEGCRVELFRGAGHFPHLDDPDRFAALVREFVARSR
ncbi:alpha/beta fold hydrolase [Phycicoccus sp.]|uniref:alpha/beta fold hydrolase n=1 Tax=Phycicoccus sp. TaxID=1902410 RepID=UPI002CFCF080|nr:alpha/beta fold hydrolase [Phycicoccus sp.]HMM95464.1 alpha/beta fold hydrolase [Phycicoccus sp.]